MYSNFILKLFKVYYAWMYFSHSSQNFVIVFPIPSQINLYSISMFLWAVKCVSYTNSNLTKFQLSIVLFTQSILSFDCFIPTFFNYGFQSPIIITFHLLYLFNPLFLHTFLVLDFVSTLITVIFSCNN